MGPADVPGLPPVAAADAAAAVVAIASPLEMGLGLEAPPAASWTGWFGLTKVAWAQWLLLGSAPLVGLGLILGVYWLVAGGRHVEPVVEPSETKVAAQPAPTVPKPAPKPLKALWDRRWLPDRAALVFRVRGAQLASQPQVEKSIRQFDPQWRVSIGPMLRSLGLTPDSVQRLTWASSDLAVWPERSVVVLELAPGHDTDTLAHLGEAADVGMADLVCRRTAGAAWPHPLVVVDRQTVVTGDESLLRGLAQRTDAHLESAALDRLLAVVAPDADALLLVDLAAARAAHWKLPTALLDVWPAQKRSWRDLWDIPVGAGCTLYWSDPRRSEVVLVCESETAADKVRLDLDGLLPAVKRLLPKQFEALQDALEASKLAPAAADPYRTVLEEGRSALETAQVQAGDGMVWLRWNWPQPPLTLAAAAIDGFPVMRADWLAAGRVVDEANYRRILLGNDPKRVRAGLLGYQDAEGHFPAGASGSSLLPPETRLSWIADLLPYLGHRDWHGQLEFGYSWNSAQNRSVTERPLPEMINPVLGPARTDAGFPVTHYVGVAGVGPDAGRLKADDPRAGVFGYGRTTRPDDITRGTSNTLAILGASDRCGAWASGGDATVRPLTQRPYVNGPDGFGSGQPDGMLAGMADGSVRFISKDVDPRVLEQLATIRGGDGVTAAALDVKPAGPKSNPPGPDETPEKGENQPADESAAPEAPPHAALPKIDVEARLADAIPEIDLPNVPLGEAIDTLSAMSTIPITVDPDALLAAGVSLRDPVSVHLTATTVGKALEAILASRKLSFLAEDGRVLITSPAEYRETLRPVRYAVVGPDRRTRPRPWRSWPPWCRNSWRPTPGNPTADAAPSGSTKTPCSSPRPGPSTTRSSPSAKSCALRRASRCKAGSTRAGSRWPRAGIGPSRCWRKR